MTRTMPELAPRTLSFRTTPMGGHLAPMDLTCTMVSNLESSCPEVDTLPPGHRGPTGAHTGEHVDTRSSRIARDNEDAAKLSQWLSEHNPFPKIDVIMSIDLGIVGGNEVNCHLSEEIERDMISKMMGKKFENVKFKRKGKVVTLASINNFVKMCNISIVVDRHILFHRLCIAKQSDNDLKEFFKFELSSFPILLFTGESMRKGTKSSLYTSFSPITEDVKPEGSQYVVVDGGHLLHKLLNICDIQT
ncbi:hypothetical protein AVEN_179435-1 [Araneus ventricosus]|uniref:Uncharacterized protein n=1 Tax=Araneus ventricosus TaxID=182803 RepID=A0A4Y2BDZ0_ARAVE|nr:hypothetical protein AVEN_179435-1 [Araneus ventricosus]